MVRHAPDTSPRSMCAGSRRSRATGRRRESRTPRCRDTCPRRARLMGLLSGRSSPDCTSTRAAAAGPRWRYRPTAPGPLGSLVPSKGCALCSWGTTTTTRGAASTRCALAYLQLVCDILTTAAERPVVLRAAHRLRRLRRGQRAGGAGRARDQRHRRDVRQNGCLSATGITCTM